MEKTYRESEGHEIPNLDMSEDAKEAHSAHEAPGTPVAPIAPPVNGKNIKTHLSNSVFVMLSAALAIAAIVFLGYRGYNSYNSPEAQLFRVEKENETMMERVRSLMLLPEGVSPIVYTIEDPATLIKEQSFFIGAERGDKLLLYPNIAKAVIYSPSRNIIVNAGPVEFGSSNAIVGQ